MEQGSRIYLWDNLKVVLMVMVVITHCVNVYQLQMEYWIQFLWIFIMTFTMPLFTLISGYFYKERSISYLIERFLYPCIIFSIVNYLVGILSGAYPNGISPKSGFAMWYLWALFIYNIITPVFLKKYDEKKLIFIAMAMTFICGFKFISNNILDSCRVVSFYVFFTLGIFLKKIIYV
nr:acyltransferase family protein [Fibrobacter sp. UWB4]